MGRKMLLYNEDDVPNAINVYGHRNRRAEKFCCRCESIFSYNKDKYIFLAHGTNIILYTRFYCSSIRVKNLLLPADIFISPAYIPDLAHATLNLLVDNEAGIWHLVNKGNLSWYALAVLVAERAGLDIHLIQPGYNIETAAPRPRNSALTSRKYNLMPALDTALDHFFLHYNEFLKLSISKR